MTGGNESQGSDHTRRTDRKAGGGERRDRPERRGRGLGGEPIAPGSPLFGGTLDPGAGAEDLARTENAYDTHADPYRAAPAPRPTAPALPDLRALLPATEEERSLDDWGRSERVLDLLDPLLDFYYRYWFRVECEAIERVPSSGGALLVCNHSGALPPDGPMIIQALRKDHPAPRPVYMLGEHWFKGYPGVGMLANKIGMVAAHPANAQRLLFEEGRLALVFPEGQKGTRKVLWQRYRLRRFGRGGFVRTAIRARVPIVPIALTGAEEAMPIFAHLGPLQRATGLIYAPLNHAFPHFGLLAGLMYLPAKFRIRFLEPVRTDELDPEVCEDASAVQAIAEEVRGRIQAEVDDMIARRTSVWLG